MPKSGAEIYADEIVWTKAHKRCYKCGRQDAYTLNGKLECAECHEKHICNNLNYYHKHREQILQKRRERHKSDIENGICTRCHKEKAVDGLKTCEKCRAYIQKQNQKRSEKKGTMPIQYCIEMGICTNCRKNKSMPDNKLCPNCYEILRKNREKSYGENKNHWWRKDNHFVFKQF